MTKWILKMLVPSSDKLSAMAAQAVKETINSLPDDRTEKLMKSSQIAAEANKAVEQIAKWLADGKMSDEETAKLAGMLEPVVRKILRNVKENM